MSINIGLDLCDEYISGYLFEDKLLLNAPAVICREKKEDNWHTGEEAYRLALSGNGVLTDKLLSLLQRGGTSTIARRAYTGKQLISKLIGAMLTQLTNGAELESIDRLVISLHHADRSNVEQISQAAADAGVRPEAVSVISHSDAFVYYTLNQSKDFYANMTALFDLTEESLAFYKMKTIRGISKNSVVVEAADLEENFRIGILKKESGSELGDRIMTDAAKRCMSGDIYSAVILTGKGFERTDWAKNFIEYICQKRRVIYENGLFAIGAANCAALWQDGQEAPYLIFSESSLAAEISVKVRVGERESKLVLVPAGKQWYGARAYVEVLLHEQNYIDIDIIPVDKFKGRKTVRVMLDNFPERPDRCTRLALSVDFDDCEYMNIHVSDLGFGELYPASDAEVNERVDLYN